MSKSEEFLRTSSSGHLAVVLIRGDCVSKLQINFVKLSYSAKKTCNFETFCANFFQRQGKICKQIKISSTVLLSILLNELPSDVGLRRTCAYYRTFAHAMCVRKCVRKGFETVRAMCVRVAHFWVCDVRSHFYTL